MIIFGSRIKELRISKNVRQMDLATYLGIKPRAFRFYETGDREPSLTNLVKLADFFNVSTDYLLGRTDDPTRH